MSQLVPNFLTRRRTTPRGRGPKGFTLIELLVSIGIIGLLVALMLPAILSAREAARATQCRNHLHQLGLACHLFHDAHNALPPSEIADSWATWAVFILPALEQRNLYDRWDLTRRYHVQPLNAGRDLPVFHCPSRPFPPRDLSRGTTGFYRNGLFPGPPGWSDYGVCVGTRRALDNGAFSRAVDITTNLPSAQLGSSFLSFSTDVHPGWRLPVSFRDLAGDGMTNTILLGEMHIRPGTTLDVVYNGDNFFGFSRIAGHDGPPDPVTGQYPVVHPLVRNPNYAGTDWHYRFGSQHIGRCHFAFADGSVRSLSVDIDIDTLDRLARRGDGLPILADQ